VTSVTFLTALGGDGSTVTDDSNATTGMGNGGHRYRFVSSLVNLVAIAQTAVSAANAAVTSPGSLTATSTSSLAVGTGSKSLTLTQAGKGFNVGGYVIVASAAAPATYMYGQITAFTAGTGAMTVNVLSVGGAGTLTAWMISSAQPNLALYSPSTGMLGLYFDGVNMAIGGATSVWGIGVKALEFGNNGAVTNLSNGDFYFGQNSYYNGTNWIAKTTGLGSFYKQSAGTHTWYGAASVAGGAVQTLVQKWQLDASGNGTLAGALNTASMVSLASAATVAIGAAASNNITITGTTTITAFDTVAAGIRRTLTFGGALTLTHNATTLILLGAANITTVAGDVAEMQSLGGGNWKCINYMRSNGAPLALANASVTTVKLLDANVTRAKAANDLLGVAQNTQTSNYTLALTDIGGHIYATNAGAQTITIPTNATIAFPLGAAISIINSGTTVITISATGVTLKQAGTTNTGNRTLALNGLATLIKVATDTWFISGAGLT
jgi:hypothetical protein